MKRFFKFFKSILAACPYSIVGKTCVHAIKGNTIKKPRQDNRTQTLKKGIKTGTNIALIGVFCPFLWYAILSGQSKNFIILNLMHSGVIVGIGLLIVLLNYLRILYFKHQSYH